MSDWFASHSLQLAFLTVYLGLLAYHAWLGQRRSRSLDDYLVGGRSLGGMVIALSFYATFVSSVTFVGHAGRSYTQGPAWWLTCVVVFTVMIVVAWFVVAPAFMRRARELGSLTIPDFLGHRYNSLLLRRLAGLVVIVASVAYMIAVYDGAARLLESLLGLDAGLILLLIFFIVTAYTLAGGFHSVVATDAVQGVILFLGGMALPLAMIVDKGGLGPLLADVRQANPSAMAWPEATGLIAMIGLAVGVGLKFVVEPRQLSRFYGLASDEQLRRGRWIAPVLLCVTYLCMLPVGFMAHAFVPAENLPVDLITGVIQTKHVVPYLLGTANVLGPIGGAFFLTGLVAAAMSSLDSVLLVAASSADHDVIAPHRTSGSAMWWTRGWVLLLSAAAAVLAWWLDRGIVEMSAFSGSMYAACFLPTLIVGLFWRRATPAGAIAGLLTGLAATVIWFTVKNSAFDGAMKWMHEVYVGVALAMAAYVGVSLCRVRCADR